MHRHMRHLALIGPAALLLLAACSRPFADRITAPESGQLAARASFRLEVEREGGLGGLWIRESVEGATGRFIVTTHQICSVSRCQAAMDSASGVLDPATVVALMAEVESAAVWSLRDEYGRTPHAADMMVHTLTVRADGREKSVRGDDGTFPDRARRVQGALHAAIERARGAGPH